MKRGIYTDTHQGRCHRGVCLSGVERYHFHPWLHSVLTDYRTDDRATSALVHLIIQGARKKFQFVFVPVCLCACVCVYVSVYKSMCLYVCVCACLYVYRCLQMCLYLCACVSVYPCMCLCICVYVYVCVCARVSAHSCICLGVCVLPRIASKKILKAMFFWDHTTLAPQVHSTT